jgi:hypothetical protein
MRYTKILFKVIAGVAFVGATAAVSFAGLNPTAPGLPTVTVTGYGGGALPNNQLSGMCVACHNRAVYGTTIASHFVFDDAHRTNSGGGWTSADYTKTGAPRDGGQYFHVTAWTTAGIWSKYGNFATKTSETGAPAGSVGYELATKNIGLAALAADEIICESCHNIVKNVAGGNNLVEAPGDVIAPAGAQAWTDSKVATLCVGCHGWLYDSNAANDNNNMAAGGNFDNTWNLLGEAAAAAKKDSNAAEWKNDGVKHNVNHHVMSGDVRAPGIATAMVNWSPTTAFDPNQTHRMTTTPIAGAGYAVKATWEAGFRQAAVATNFSCLSCHTVAHGGAIRTGASILRGTTTGPAATGALDRISDGRSWKDQDANVAAGVGTWCQNCHKN